MSFASLALPHSWLSPFALLGAGQGTDLKLPNPLASYRERFSPSTLLAHHRSPTLIIKSPNAKAQVQLRYSKPAGAPPWGRTSLIFPDSSHHVLQVVNCFWIGFMPF